MVKRILSFVNPAITDGSDIELFNHIVNSMLTVLLLLIG